MMTPEQRTRAQPNRDWLIRKNGYFYRPERAGYTMSVHDAGRYTEAEAKAEATVEVCITAHHVSDFEDTSARREARANCIVAVTEAAVALRIEQLEAQNAMLVEALTRVLANACPMTGNPSPQRLNEFWADELEKGRGEAGDMLFALAALANVEAARTGASHA